MMQEVFILKDSLFQRIEKKTNIKKETILDLAKKIQKNNPKDENTLREIIHELSQITGKEVSLEKENKIIEAIQKDRIPNQMDKLF